jgi:hypothetical protein
MAQVMVGFMACALLCAVKTPASTVKNLELLKPTCLRASPSLLVGGALNFFVSRFNQLGGQDFVTTLSLFHACIHIDE